MIIYQVENKDGCGPYWADWFGTSWICKAHDIAGHTPNVVNDIEGFEEKMLCGFMSMKDLKDWFHGWLDLLVFAGFRVVEYDVVGVIAGSKQVCFISR